MVDAAVGVPAPAVTPTPLQALAAAGVIGGDWAGEAVAVDVSRSHRVHRVTVGSSVWVVKQAAEGDERSAEGRDLGAETYVYRLAGWIPALAGVVPAARLVDERRRVLVLEAHEPVVTFGGAALAAAVGRALAAVHMATAGVPLPYSAASGVLDLADTDPDQVLLKAEASRRLAAEAAEDLLLADALRAGRLAWTPSCLVHADLKWDNVLVAADGGVRLIDWELAGLGDPAWDVAGWVAQGVSLGGVEDPDNVPGFVRTYASAAQPDSGFWERVAVYVCPRMVHRVLEHADGGGEVVPELLEVARDLARRVEETVAALEGWAAL